MCFNIRRLYLSYGELKGLKTSYTTCVLKEHQVLPGLIGECHWPKHFIMTLSHFGQSVVTKIGTWSEC